MTQNSSPFAVGQTPVSRHLETGKGLVLGVALPVLVCGMRGEVGFFNLTYGSLFATTFALLMATWLANFPLVTWLLGGWIAQGDTSLRFFALAFLAAGLYQRYKRKQQKWNPDRPHGHSLGITRFGFLPLREDYIYRYVDPSVTFLIGALLRYRLGFALLGLYWMLAGVALLVAEFSLYQQTEMNDWGLGDRKKEAERDGEVFKAMSGQAAEAKRGSRATYGIPTGSDAELAAQIEKRKRERAGETAAERGTL